MGVEWESGERPEGMCSGKRWVLGMQAFQREFSWGWLMQIAQPAKNGQVASTTEERTVPHSGTSCLCFPLESWMESWVMGLGVSWRKVILGAVGGTVLPLLSCLVGPPRAAGW